MESLVDLNISSCPITELSPRINNLELEAFWLYKVPIKELHMTPEKLSRLLVLGIAETNIYEYSFLKNLTNINYLAIGNTHLRDFGFLSACINLKSLRIFNVSDIDTRKIASANWLQSLFLIGYTGSIDFIYLLTNLTELAIRQCNISGLTEDLHALKNLRSLELYNTNIGSIPSCIGDLPLDRLSILDTDVRSLPPELGNLNCSDFTFVDSKEKCISPPKSVVKEGEKAIFAYLKDLLQREHVWSSKLVVVGEGGTGKSCLIDSLLNKPFKSGKNTTHGINIKPYFCQHPIENVQMRLNVWDFGGQDIYHATHQFYLTNHSLFILIWSARLGYDAGKVYKWLEVITALAPDSPIFIVATNSGPRGADLPKGDIEKQFGKKISFFEIDNKTRSGIEKLKEAIAAAAAGLKYMGVELPRTWISAQEKIYSLKTKYANKETVEEVIQKSSLAKASLESFLNYLHDLGEILYYPQDDILKNTIILKPSWVSKQIAKVLDSKPLAENAGFLTKEMTQHLWKDLKPEIQEKLLGLMEKFDLSYKTKDDKEISLIVEKLKFEEPNEYEQKWLELEDKNEISFKYMLETIPPGIPTWFIARTHRFSTKIHWRYGVLLANESKNHYGLVLTSPERKEVWLKVKGDMPHYFFTQLRDTMELTFNRFEGLNVTTLVPCPGHNGKPCSHLFDLHQLEKRLSIKNPKLTIECPQQIEEVDVMKMLFGISFAPQNSALVERITTEIKGYIDDKVDSGTTELKKFLSLEFVKLYRAQQEIADLTCPNTFILAEIQDDGLETDIMFHRYHMHLCCQMPGCNHVVGEPYLLRIPRTWLKTIGPYYNRMIQFLKFTLPLVIPGAKMLIEKAEYEAHANEVEILKEGLKLLPDFDASLLAEDLTHSTANDSMPIRLIRQILDAVDPQQDWRKLRRLVTPEGHVLWLCQEHYSQYTV